VRDSAKARSRYVGCSSIALLAASALLTCARNEVPRVAPDPNAPFGGASSSAEQSVDGSEQSMALTSAESAALPRVGIIEPDVLKALEQNGFALGKLVAGVEARTSAELNRGTAFKSIFAVLGKDLIKKSAADLRAKVTSHSSLRAS
jgi:hypothetical protein